MGLIYNPQTMRYEFMPDMGAMQAQPAMQANQMQQPMVNNQPATNINWVQGEQSARAWMVTPGTTALLMDSEANRFYMKSADNSGMPRFKAYEYHEISNEEPITPLNNNEEYATKKEIADIRAEIERISSLMEQPQPTTTRKKEVAKNE